MKRSEKSKKLRHPPYNKFKAYLVENNIKLKEIAELLNLTTPTISGKNNGHFDYTMDEVVKICKHYNISTEIFCNINKFS